MCNCRVNHQTSAEEIDVFRNVPPSKVEGGDEEIMLYFAYGSDLNWSALLDWGKAKNQFIPPRSAAQPAVLAHHRLCFPAYEPFWRGGVADAVSEPGKSVGGALYEVGDGATSILDRLADRRLDPQGREVGARLRSKVKVNLFKGGRAVEAYVYRLRHNQRGHIHVPPAENYLEGLVDAAWRLGLSTMWIMHLRSFTTQASTPAATVPTLSRNTLRLEDSDVHQQWPGLGRPEAVIEANRIRIACDPAAKQPWRSIFPEPSPSPAGRSTLVKTMC